MTKMKVVVVMGEPGTGKSTFMRHYMSRKEWRAEFTAVKMVPYHTDGAGLYILGKYEDGEVFAGTDRMSMAVQPEAVAFLKKVASEGAKAVLFEGDRLSNQSFIEHCIDNYDTTVIYFDVNVAERQRRYAERGSDQSEQFLRGRETKYGNLRTNLFIMMNLVEFKHETPEDTLRIIQAVDLILR